MDHLVRVEVAEALRDLQQLVTRVSVPGQLNRTDPTRMVTYKRHSVCIGVLPNVFREITIKNEVRNELGRRDGNASER